MSVAQEHLSIQQSRDVENSFPSPDVTISEFKTLIHAIICVITELYISPEVATVDEVELALEHDRRVALTDTDDVAPIFQHLWETINEIKKEVKQEKVDRAISYSDPEVLKKHVAALTGGKLGEASTEVNPEDPDRVIGHFLYLYWRMIWVGA